MKEGKDRHNERKTKTTNKILFYKLSSDELVLLPKYMRTQAPGIQIRFHSVRRQRDIK